MTPRTAMCAGYSVGIKEAIRKAQRTLQDYQAQEPGELWETTKRRLQRELDRVLKDLDNANPFDAD